MPPIYEYSCKACKKEFEAIISYSTRLGVKCPECNGDVQIRISQIAGHRYYGPPDGGFHKTNMKAP